MALKTRANKQEKIENEINLLFDAIMVPNSVNDVIANV